MINPFMPRPLPVQYPEQYIGLEDELLKRHLTIINKNWYVVDSELNASPIHPSVFVHEVKASDVKERISGKLVEYLESKSGPKGIPKQTPPLPVLMKWDMDNCDDHYHLLKRAQKYPHMPPNYLDTWLIKEIAKAPTYEVFGHSLQVLGSTDRTRIHWIEANKEELFRKFLVRAGVPKNWKEINIL